MNPALIRIVLRYGLGALATWGWLSPDLAMDAAMDPDVIAMVSVVAGFAVEGWYWAAKRWGWGL